MKKRIVSLLLTVIMLFSLSLVSFAESKLEKAVAGDVISNITFDDYTGGTYGTKESLAYSENPAALVKDGPDGAEDKAIGFTNTKTTVFRVFPGSGQNTNSSRIVIDSDLLMYSYDVKIECPTADYLSYIPEKSRHKNFPFLQGKMVLLDNSGNDSWPEITPTFCVHPQTMELRVCFNSADPNLETAILRTISPDTWYTVEHFFDFSVSGKLSYEIKIINKSTGNIEASFKSAIENRLSAAKKVYYHNLSSVYAHGATFAFDNFKYTEMFVPSINEVKYVSSSDAETTATAKLIPASAKAVKLNIYADDINNEDISIKMDGVALGNDKYSVSCDSAADCVTITPEVGAFKANAKLEIDIADKDSVMLYVGNDKLLYVASSVSSNPTITGAVEAVNGSNTDDAVITLITASYNGNTLTGVDTKPVTVTAGKKVSDSLTITPESDSNEARVFVFENMDLIKPLIGRKSVSVVSE